jgi:hypothetical protein
VSAGSPIHIYVTRRTRHQLDEIARTSKLSRSAIIRLLITTIHRDPELLPRMLHQEMTYVADEGDA